MQPSYAQIKGQERDDFISESAQACLSSALKLNSQTKAPYTARDLKSYCVCIGTYLADTLTDKQQIELEKIAKERIVPKWYADINNAGGRYCMNKVWGIK